MTVTEWFACSLCRSPLWTCLGIGSHRKSEDWALHCSLSVVVSLTPKAEVICWTSSVEPHIHMVMHTDSVSIWILRKEGCFQKQGYVFCWLSKAFQGSGALAVAVWQCISEHSQGYQMRTICSATVNWWKQLLTKYYILELPVTFSNLLGHLSPTARCTVDRALSSALKWASATISGWFCYNFVRNLALMLWNRISCGDSKQDFTGRPWHRHTFL